MKGVLAPGGVIYRVSPDGKDWEILANGFRNTYDAAFNREGDLFTYDADMEWDVGTPWYRPTRICHAASGAEFGWRNGAGKWPSSYPDSLPSALDIGPGSPTGVAFGYGTKFPPRYRDSLFVADWTFGRLYAVHLRPDGASYRGESEVFLSGIPLPVADVVAHPTDGALYFITGGWRTQTGLYRVTHDGGDGTAPAADPAPDPASITLHTARRKLESFHGRRDPGAVEAIWPFLGHEDRFLRFAARVALEWQDPAAWRERALAEKEPRAALTALVALARTGARDEFHRKPDDAKPDPALQPRLLAALDRLDWAALDAGARIDLLRAYALAFTRLGPPDDATRARLLARLEPWFPAGERAIDGELCQMLVFLRSARVVPLALPLIAKAPTQEEQLDYVKSLRLATAGWTPELRREYFSWFHRAAAFHGGASFTGFVQMVKNDATANLGEAELAALKDVLEAPPPASPMTSSGAALAGRTQATDWTMAGLAPALAGGLRGRDFERGRAMFGATGCFLCHRFAGEGGAVGPDLTLSAGRFSPAELLESILEPGKTVSDLYGNMVIAKRGGETVVGRVVYLREDSVMVNPNMFNPAETVLVDRKEVVSMEPSKVSPMPAGLLSMLAREEILDLVAYVLSGGDSGHAMFGRGADASP
jgi:putative heme-binding domain-containing protein